MPTLTKMLKPEPERKVIAGEVLSRIAINKYLVNIGGRSLLCRSSISSTVNRGARVVVNKADEAYYIIGVEKQRSRSLQTVIVNG